MQPSKERQKITCVDCVPEEKHLVNLLPNPQPPKKKSNHRINAVPDPEDALELLVMDVLDKVAANVVLKVAVEVEVEEEATIRVQGIGNQMKKDHLALDEGEIVPRALVPAKDIFSWPDDPHQDPYQK